MLRKPTIPALANCLGFLLAFGLASLGAVAADAAAEGDGTDWKKEREFWSFTPPRAQPKPGVKNKSWPRQPVDFFVLAQMEQRKLSPAAEAEKRTLIRRVTFDLTGLPPTPEEVDAFLKDKRQDAYAELVARLLASPRFGERMASLWLPLARYAEDQAHQVGADTKAFYPNAYKYRAWVINAFNRDLPYDQFLKLQLAADKFIEQFKAQGSKFKVENAATGAKQTNFEPGNLNLESEDLAALGLLGLGPKYYNRGRLEVQAEEWEDRVDTVTRAMLGLTVACARCHNHKYDPITTRDYYALAGVFASIKMVNKTPDGKAEEGTPEAAKMRAETLHIIEDDKVQDLNVFIRGNVERKGPVAERRFLKILSEGEPVLFKDGSGRMELAAAIADRRNPLTARVLVNRAWGMMFGKPLVASPSNFGHFGERPTHPELLDDLAVRFMDGGWSVKSLVRELALSATYRQVSLADAKKAAADAENSLLSHMNRRRLTVEQWRDGALFVAGALDFTGGKSLELDSATNQLRTVYARVSRLKLNDLLTQFDYPDANVHAEKRAVTTTATQKLFMLNSPFALAQAKTLAAKLNADPKETDTVRVTRAYQLIFGREPQRDETKLALEFLQKPALPEMSRWEQYAQLLLASNEFLYVD